MSDVALSVAPAKVFLYYLDQLESLLHKIADYNEELFSARLVENMFPLGQQASTAMNFVLRSLQPLAGQPIQTVDLGPRNFADLQRFLVEVKARVQALPHTVNGAQVIAARAGFAEHHMEAEQYFLHYTLPNFFFHYSAVYLIARHFGVPLSKGDFDGFHRYPAQFSFPSR